MSELWKEAITLYLTGVVSGLFSLINSEAATVLAVVKYDTPAWLAALACASGQTTMYLLLYQFGELLIKKWVWFHDQIERAKTRYADHLDRNVVVLTAIGALLGVPPLFLMAALAPGLNMRRWVLCITVWPIRAGRFWLIATFSEQLKFLWA